MTDDGGFVLLHRRLFSNPAFLNAGEALAFMWLVARAAWRPSSVRYKGRLINLERGQVAISLRDFGAAMERDRSWASRFINKLEREQMVRHQRDTNRDTSETPTETGVNVISICNYDKYQVIPIDDETPREQETRQRRTESETQNNKENERKKEKTPKGVQKKESPILPDWVPIEAWNGWAEMRRRKGSPLTDRAATLAVNKLDEFRHQGHDPGKVLDECTLHNWTGIYLSRDAEKRQVQERMMV